MEWEEEQEKNLESLMIKVIEILAKDRIEIPQECIKFVERTLRIKDYNVEKAAKFIVSYRSTVACFKATFEKYDPKCVETLFSDGVYTVLKSRDDLGRQVLITRMGRWHPKLVDFDNYTAAWAFLLTWIVGQSKETQRKGVVIIYDLTNFGFEQATQLKLGTLIQVFQQLRNGAPGKIKGIHMVFHPRIFQPVFKILKPFMKSKLLQRLHFHGDDLSKLHQHLDPEILPASLGGQLAEEEAIDRESLKRFEMEDDIHKKFLKYGMGWE